MCTDMKLKIPTVLVTLKKYLLDTGSLSLNGLFRLTGDEKELKHVKDQLNKGAFTGCTDKHCVANLIKVWFRELPQHVLNVIPKQKIW